MTSIALLKGINVGAKNRINMVELKSLLTEYGFEHVTTYINTGNVIIKSAQTHHQLSEELETLIQLKLGLMVPVISRTLIEYKKMILSCPYGTEQLKTISEGKAYECFYVAFLSRELTVEQIEKLNAYKTNLEDYLLIEKNIFLLLEGGIRESKLVKQLMKIDKKVTTRNWNTVLKLDELASHFDLEN